MDERTALRFRTRRRSGGWPGPAGRGWWPASWRSCSASGPLNSGSRSRGRCCWSGSGFSPCSAASPRSWLLSSSAAPSAPNPSVPGADALKRDGSRPFAGSPPPEAATGLAGQHAAASPRSRPGSPVAFRLATAWFRFTPHPAHQARCPDQFRQGSLLHRPARHSPQLRRIQPRLGEVGAQRQALAVKTMRPVQPSPPGATAGPLPMAARLKPTTGLALSRSHQDRETSRLGSASLIGSLPASPLTVVSP